MTKKHLTPAGWKDCGATKRACRYGDSAHKTVTDPQGKSHLPVAQPATIAPVPTKENCFSISEESFNYGWANGVDYDYKEETDCYSYGCIDEGICRCGRIYNAEVYKVDANSAIKNFVEGWDKIAPVSQKKILTYLDKHLQFSSPDSWNVEVEPGYYGDEIGSVTFTKQDELRKTLNLFALKEPNFTDELGILTYVRGKGTGTAGLTPLEALKAQLAAENPNTTSLLVEKANQITKSKIALRDIMIPNKGHFANVKPATMPKSDAIAGVVFKDRNGKYRLIDGYNRLKGLTSKVRRTTADPKATYIVLSTKNSR